MKAAVTFFCITLVIFSSYASQTTNLFCESGDPAGLGPNLYLDLTDKTTQLEINIELNINSADPLNRRPNLSIQRYFVVEAAASNEGLVLPLSAAYQIVISKIKDGNSYYWLAVVESRTNKFESIQLSCQE